MEITFVGLAKAGKSSIIKKFFQNSSLIELESIAPTIYRDIIYHHPNWSVESIRLRDLAGQQVYRDKHLLKENFSTQDIIIFVIDVLDLNENYTKTYFNSVKKFLLSIRKDNLPYVAFFIHKYDPETRELITQESEDARKILKNISTSINITKSELKDLHPRVFFTSIYDSSIYDCFNIIFLHFFQAELLNYALTMIDPSKWDYLEHDNIDLFYKYLKLKGEEDGNVIRDTFLKILLENNDFKLNKRTINYNIESTESKVSLTVDINSIDISEKVNAENSILVYIKSLIRPLWLQIENIQRGQQLIITFSKKKDEFNLNN